MRIDKSKLYLLLFDLSPSTKSYFINENIAKTVFYSIDEDELNSYPIIHRWGPEKLVKEWFEYWGGTPVEINVYNTKTFVTFHSVQDFIDWIEQQIKIITQLTQ